MLREVLYFEDVLYRIESLMVYNNLQKDEVLIALKDVSLIIAYDQQLKGINEKYYGFATSLLKKAEELGLSGNLLRQYTAYLFLKDENMFSVACEKGLAVKNSTLYTMALKDMGVMQYLMDFDLKNLCENVGYGEKLFDYTPVNARENPELDYLGQIPKADDILDQLMLHYRQLGCGRFAESSMSYVDDAGEIKAVQAHDTVTLASVPGYKKQKDMLKVNTEAFINGKASESLVLTGSGGIGRFACIKALADRYSDKGLRLVELDKTRLKYIPKLFSELGRRGKRFIICIDNLTFEDFRENYEYFRICLNRAMELRPRNVIVYAVAAGQAEQQKLMSGFFPNSISFDELNDDEYADLVIEFVKHEKIVAPEDFLRTQAKEFAKGGIEKNSRTAKEFVKKVVFELNKQ